MSATPFAPLRKGQIVAQLINAYLGPAFPRAGSKGATLNALRVRLETNDVRDEPLEKLTGEVREAIRTECNKVPFPNPPSPALLTLIVNTDIVLTGVPLGNQRTFYFPGNRVAVLGSQGVHPLAATSLDLRRKRHGNTDVAEALVHVDGREGGSFRWVAISSLQPLSPAVLGSAGVTIGTTGAGATAHVNSAVATVVAKLQPTGAGRASSASLSGVTIAPGSVAAASVPGTAIAPASVAAASVPGTAPLPSAAALERASTASAPLLANQSYIRKESRLQEQPKKQPKKRGRIPAKARNIVQNSMRMGAGRQLVSNYQQKQQGQQHLQLEQLNQQAPQQNPIHMQQLNQQQQQKPVQFQPPHPQTPTQSHAQPQPHSQPRQLDHQFFQQQRHSRLSSQELAQQKGHENQQYASQQYASQPQLGRIARHQKQKVVTKGRKEEETRIARTAAQPMQRDVLPPSFVPESLRTCSPPPRKRLRGGIAGPISLTSGSILGASNAARTLTKQKGLLNFQNRNPSIVMKPHTLNGSLVSGSTGSLSPTSRAASPALSARSALPNHSPKPPRAVDAITEKVMVIERLVARRQNVDAGGVVEYYTKWHSIGWDGCSWESRSALLEDVPALVLEFDARHPQEPTAALGHAREPAAGERESLDRLIGEMKRKAAAEAAEIEEQRKRDSAPIMIPVWFERPLLELSFADGMVMHFRREEATVFNDPTAAGRDQKRRRFRFKTEFPEAARRLFLPTVKGEAISQRMDARAIIETCARERKLQGSRLIHFPRALGSSLVQNVAGPIRRADIEAAPPSWESYLLGLGLECSSWERDYLPDMPTVADTVHRTVQHAQRAIEAESRELVLERQRRLLGPTESRLSVSVASPRVPRNGIYDEDIQGPVPIFTNSSEFVELDDQVGRTGVELNRRLLRARNNAFGKAIVCNEDEEKKPASGAARYYDSVFNCWRFSGNET